MLNDMNVEVSQKEQKKFYEYQNHILAFASLLEAPLHLIVHHTRKSLGALRNGIWGTITWKCSFPNTLKWRCWTHILKRTEHFIFT